MDAPELSCTFINVTDINNTTPYSERNRLIASLEPIQSVWYPSSLAQDEGWFCNPMYFVDGGDDGIQHVFCWSLSIDEGSGLNYLWRVNWNFHSEPTLSFYQRFQEHGLCHLEIHGYLFCASGRNSRAIWREINTPIINNTSFTNVVLHPSIQLNWFGTSSLGSTVNLLPQSPSPALLDYVYGSTDNLVHSLSDLCVSLGDTLFSSELIPPFQFLDTSSEIPITLDACSLCDSSSEAGQIQSRGVYFHKDARGKITLNVPCTLKDRDAVNLFLEEALGQLDEGVRLVKCSLCKNKKVDKEWRVKPANLRRHILAHLGIKGMSLPNGTHFYAYASKDYHCSAIGCGDVFTTKDQAIKHMEKKHSGLYTRKLQLVYQPDKCEGPDKMDEPTMLTGPIYNLS